MHGGCGCVTGCALGVRVRADTGARGHRGEPGSLPDVRGPGRASRRVYDRRRTTPGGRTMSAGCGDRARVGAAGVGADLLPAHVHPLCVRDRGAPIRRQDALPARGGRLRAYAMPRQPASMTRPSRAKRWTATGAGNVRMRTAMTCSPPGRPAGFIEEMPTTLHPPEPPAVHPVHHELRPLIQDNLTELSRRRT